MTPRVGLCSRSLCDQSVIGAVRDAGLTLAFHMYTPAETIAACRSQRPEILLLGGPAGADLAPYREAHPAMKIVLLLDQPDFHAAREARWQGAAEALLLPDDLPRLPLQMRQLAEGGITPERDTGGNRLTLVCSPKGGCGSTVIAAGLALAMVPDAALVDLNLTYGGADTLLDLKPDRSVLDLAPLAAELEDRHLLQAVTAHSSGLSVLCAPASGAAGDRLDLSEARAILQACRQRWGQVVVDLPGGSVDLLAALARMADQVLIITTPDPVAMRSIHRLLQGGGLPLLPQVGLVVNRWTDRSPFHPQEVADRLQLPLLAALPDDPLLAQQVALGQPIIPADRRRAGRAATALLKLAATLLPRSQGGRWGA